jgi:hypothetical protein
MSEIIDRLTLLLPASASSDNPVAPRNSRTRAAIRLFRFDPLSMMVELCVYYNGIRVNFFLRDHPEACRLSRVSIRSD